MSASSPRPSPPLRHGGEGEDAVVARFRAIRSWFQSTGCDASFLEASIRLDGLCSWKKLGEKSASSPRPSPPFRHGREGEDAVVKRFHPLPSRRYSIGCTGISQKPDCGNYFAGSGVLGADASFASASRRRRWSIHQSGQLFKSPEREAWKWVSMVSRHWISAAGASS